MNGVNAGTTCLLVQRSGSEDGDEYKGEENNSGVELAVEASRSEPDEEEDEDDCSQQIAQD